MSEPFLGEIRIFGFNFAPQGWALCDGQILPISQNTALFSLLGTTYGGDGQTTFALPDLQGAAPIGSGQGPGLSDYFEGQVGGETAVTLTANQIPGHTHAVNASSSGGDNNNPANNVWTVPGAGRGLSMYNPDPGTSPHMNAQAFAPAQNQPHDNMMPYLVLNYCIALQGIYPARN